MTDKVADDDYDYDYDYDDDYKVIPWIASSKSSDQKTFTRFALQSECCNFNQ